MPYARAGTADRTSVPFQRSAMIRVRERTSKTAIARSAAVQASLLVMWWLALKLPIALTPPCEAQ